MRNVLMALAIALVGTGCCGSASREAAFHDGVKQYAIESGMLDEYEKYVDADPKLKDDSKKIRKATSAGLRALVAQEGKALKEQ